MAEKLLRKHNVPDDKIDPNQLRFVVKALHDVGDNWYGVGHELKIDNIEKIKQDYGSVSRCLIAMVDSLLRGRLTEKPGSPASWRTIVSAVYTSHTKHAKRLAGQLNEFQTFSSCSTAQAVDASPLLDEFASDGDIREVATMLLQHLRCVAARWFEIGALFGLPLNTLTTIKNNSTLPGDVDKLRRVLKEWLMQAEDLELETPSWQVVVDVVAHGAGGDAPSLACQLAEQHKSDSPSGTMPGGDVGASQINASGQCLPTETTGDAPVIGGGDAPVTGGGDTPVTEGGDALVIRGRDSEQLNTAAQIVVKSEALEDLAEVLQPMAASWDLFVGQLKVPDGERKTIATNMSIQQENYFKSCLTSGLHMLAKSKPTLTYGSIVAVFKGTTVPNNPLAQEIHQLGKDSDVVTSDEVDSLVEKYLHKIAASWDLFLGQLGLPQHEIKQISDCSNFARKCLTDGLYYWMVSDPNPTFGQIASVLRGDLVTNKPLAEKVEELAVKIQKASTQGTTDTTASKSDTKPTEASTQGSTETTASKYDQRPSSIEDSEYDSETSGDEAHTVVTDSGWPWAGEKTHYPPYRRKSSKRKAITLQEQDGKLTPITTGNAYDRPSSDMYYPMKPAKLPHGIALIVSNKNFAQHKMREGTEKDVQNLRRTFQYLGYEILIRRDCTSLEMEGFFKEGGLVYKKVKQEHNSFVCCILSHGDTDFVFGKDSKPVNVSQKNGIQYEIAHCSPLKTKPKLFFIQACRGGAFGRGIEFDSDSSRLESDYSKQPMKADFYVSNATVQGEKSTRHLDFGSRYVLELCRAFLTSGHNSTLSSMHKTVNRKVGEYREVSIQQPVAEDLLVKSVYFFEDLLP